MTERVMTTGSGHTLNLLNPSADAIDARDVAVALSHIPRYCGHRGAYSVGAHSLVVASILRNDGRAEHVVRGGALHDATEAYLQDLPRDVKYVLGELPGCRAGYNPYVALETRVMDAICTRFKLELSPEEWRIVKFADDLALSAEVYSLWPEHLWERFGPGPRFEQHIALIRRHRLMRPDEVQSELLTFMVEGA